jgi:myo-inositol 2-dehydrogenase/D-chiro-inositol 1-dehydrogenase
MNRTKVAIIVTGEEGRAVLEIIYAAYALAGLGKKVALPYTAKAAKPTDLWLNPKTTN